MPDQARTENDAEIVRDPRRAFNASEAECCTCVDVCRQRTNGICRCLPEPPMPGSVADITAGLRALRDQKFITEWGRHGSRWVIVCGATFGPYTTREAFGFVEGCRAMGANV